MMWGVAAAVWLWASPLQGAAPAAKIQLASFVQGPGEPLPAVAQVFDVPTAPLVVYVYTAGTLCSPRTISTTKPVSGGNGWRVEVTPANIDGPIIGIPVTLAWQRLWEGSTAITDGKKGTLTLVMQPGTAVPLDTMDGDAARVVREQAARLNAWKPGMPLPPEIAQSTFVKNLEKLLSDAQLRKAMALRDSGYNDNHPTVIAANTDIEFITSSLNTRARTMIEEAVRNLASAPPTVIDGCTATGMTLQFGALSPGKF